MSSFDSLPPEPDESFAPVFPADLGPAEPPEEAFDVAPGPPRAPHPNFWWSLLWCLGFWIFLLGSMVAVLVITLIVSALVSGDARDYLRNLQPKNMEQMAGLMAPAFLIAEVGSVVLAWLVVRLVVGPQWKRRLSVRMPSPAHLLLVVLAMPALLTIPSLIHGLATQRLPSFGDEKDSVEMFSQWPLWFGVLVVGICPGLGEELWCRGFLGRGLLGHYGRFAGVVLTSLFFGALHLNPPYAVATAAMGLWLHYVYLTSRSLPLSMFLHFLNNTIAVVLSNPAYHGGEEWLNQGMNHVTAVVAAGVLLVAVAWALFQSRARLVADHGLPPWKPPFPGVEAPPPGSGTRVWQPWPNALAWAFVVVATVGFNVTFYLGIYLGDALP